MNSVNRDPSNFMFNDEETKLIEKHVNSKQDEITDCDYNLAKDTIVIPGQNFALISIVTSNKTDKKCIKIRGVFETIEEAKQHAQKIAFIDSTYDILVVSLYEWLMIPPEYEKINDQIYMDEQLNTLISEYKENQEKSKIQFDLRKEALKQNTHGKLSFNDTVEDDF
jgi:Family of unknown function (DUF5832)